MRRINHSSRFIEEFQGKGYKSQKLNSFAQVVTGSTPSRSVSDYWLNGAHPWVSAQDMGDKFVDATAELVSDSGMATCKLIPAGSLLYVCRGSIGVMSINRIDCATNQSICSAICDDSICKTEYLYYWLLYHEDEINSLGEGTSFKSLSQKTFASLKIQIPPIEEQLRFIAITRQADKSKFSDFKSRFIEQFGSNEKTLPLSEWIGTTFPGEWGTDDIDGTGVKVIRTTNFTNTGKLDLTNVVTRDIETGKVQKKQLKPGDIILERSGGTADNPVGRVVYFEAEGIYLFNNFTQLLRCKDGVNSLYVFYSLFNYYQTHKNEIRSMGNKTTGIQNLKMDKYWEIPIVDASSESQEEFVLLYRQADKSKYLN